LANPGQNFGCLQPPSVLACPVGHNGPLVAQPEHPVVADPNIRLALAILEHCVALADNRPYRLEVMLSRNGQQRVAADKDVSMMSYSATHDDWGTLSRSPLGRQAGQVREGG
jgi:hypothetical protein